MNNKQMDEFIAKHIVKLPNVGWYKRESCWGVQNVKCKRGDVTKDYPEWKAELYYHSGDVNNLYKVPDYNMYYTNKTKMFAVLAFWLIIKVVSLIVIVVGGYYVYVRLY
ncbi:MAG: hypothetical protein E2O29_01865 [Deltaproteobacteria bacterium]|nr:MAG: hypothetical protein E2O29_01865 [Deltaproteobacteria bacterium]